MREREGWKAGWRKQSIDGGYKEGAIGMNEVREGWSEREGRRGLE